MLKKKKKEKHSRFRLDMKVESVYLVKCTSLHEEERGRDGGGGGKYKILQVGSGMKLLNSTLS